MGRLRRLKVAHQDKTTLRTFSSLVEGCMFGRLVTTIATVAALTGAPGISAQTADEPPSEEFIMNAWSDPADCNLANAKRVSFSALAAKPMGLIGKCVAVEGYWSGRALFGSTQDAKTSRSNTSDRLRGKRIGIYAQWEIVGEPPNRPTRTLFVGRAGQCETQWPSATMVMGYCHYTGGSMLLVSQAFPS